jgi:hypothetical protein
MSMGTYYIIYEHVSREIFRVEAESEAQAFDIAITDYDSRKESLRADYETAYRTARPHEIKEYER